MKKTPLYNKHVEHEGKIVDFAGFKMPIQYSSIINEVNGVRGAAGLFDVSHMGEIEIMGDDDVDFLNWITTNNVSKLKVWQAQYTTMLYPDGGIVDDLLVYRLPDRYLLVVNATNQKKDYEWIKDNEKGNVEINFKSDDYFQLAVQGPQAEPVLEKVTDKDLSEIKFYWSAEAEIKGNKFIISRTGYTGEDGFEIYGKSSMGEEVWDAIMDAGKDEGIIPCGLGARDVLRLEMGYCLYGNDITKDTSPLEAGLSWLVKMDKEDFIGKDALKKQKDEGIKRRLSGIEIKGRLIPRHNHIILKDDEKIGFVTSGSHSPSLGNPIAMGYIDKPYNKKETEIFIEVRNKKIRGEVVSLPFWKKGSLKR